jgi:hypothetical protein
MDDTDKSVLRARDFRTAPVLIAVSVFFLWRTALIPFFGGANRAGVSGVHWYDSAAIVPFFIFGSLLVLALFLLAVAIRDGGARRAVGWDRGEVQRFLSLALIFLAYIAALVPRVDFIVASGLVLTALIFGYHGGVARRMWIAAGTVGVAGIYAIVRHLPQAEWGRWDDDILALVLWGGLTVLALGTAGRDRAIRAMPFIAVLTPLILVCAMAFGFRQNVPNRGGLIFSQIEYHYYVTVRPLWRN